MASVDLMDWAPGLLDGTSPMDNGNRAKGRIDFSRAIRLSHPAPPMRCSPQMNSDFGNALESLPHGPSFRFLDALVSLDPGVEAVASYQVRGDETFLEGHFPGNPMMPGVILVEAIAQLGGVVVQTDRQNPAMTDLRLTAVRNAKILGAAVPGDQLVIHARVEGRLGGLAQIDGVVHGPAGLLATAKVTLSGKI
jgi:3-hydroxyacyl-[acyl-carrier-protein] dehydratase